MSGYTHAELARDWQLWVAYVDPGAQVPLGEWNRMSMPERLTLVEQTFGPERMEGWDVAEAMVRGAIQTAWKHADPIEGAREVTDWEDAFDIAISDPSLLVWPVPAGERGSR